jgi:hypothetical protein
LEDSALENKSDGLAEAVVVIIIVFVVIVLHEELDKLILRIQ